MPATIPIAFDDFNEWRLAHTLTRWELQKRAVSAEHRHTSIVRLDRHQFRRWVAGKLTPWRVPDHLTVTARRPLRSWPILPDQIQET